MKNKKAKKTLIAGFSLLIVILLFIIIFVSASGITEDLRGTDTVNFIASGTLRDGVYNSNNGLVYIVGENKVFASYNRTSNITTCIRCNDNTITYLANTFDINNNLIYFVGAGGIFEVYNATSNTFRNLTATDPGNWMGATTIFDITYDYNNDLVYLVGDTQLFGVYNRTSNITEDLRGTDTGNWVETNLNNGTVFSEVAFSPNNNLIYLVGGLSNTFGVYNRTSNVTEDLRGTDTGNWVDDDILFGVTVNYNSNLVYITGDGAIFGVYNRTSNVTEDLRGTDTGNWMSTGIFRKGAFDSNNNLFYLVGDNGKFGVYNRTSNITEDLSSTDTGNWMSATNIRKAVFDSSGNDYIYVIGEGGLFGVYTYLPNINFVSPTTSTGNFSQNSIEATVTSTDFDLDTITLYLYNSTSLVQSNTSSVSPLFVNFTNLPDEKYYLNATVNDSIGNTNQTTTRTIILDNVSPNMTITTANNTIGLSGGLRMTINYSVSDTYLKSCYFTLRTSSGIVHNYAENTSLACGSTSIDIYSLYSGTYVVQFWGEDYSGNLDDANLTFTIVSEGDGGGGGGVGGTTNVTVYLNKTYCGDLICQSEGNDYDIKENYWNCNQDCPGAVGENLDTLFYSLTKYCWDKDPSTICFWTQMMFTTVPIEGNITVEGPVCGDNVCEKTENMFSCSKDCWNTKKISDNILLYILGVIFFIIFIIKIWDRRK